MVTKGGPKFYVIANIESDTSLIHQEQERWRRQEERLRKLREQVQDLEQQRDSLQRAQVALGDSLKRTQDALERTQDALQLLGQTRDDQVGQLVERVLRLKDDSLALENIIPEAIQLLDVNFERDERKVLDADTTILVFIGELLRDYRDLRVEVIGHADERGTKDTNQRLSEARADTVKNYLVRKFGIDSTRIETSGRGEDEAVPARGNPTLLAKNRRVEFRILAGIRQ